MIFTFDAPITGGTVQAIPSKSMAHRLLICASFADAPTAVVCPLTSEDIDATARVLSSLGTKITKTADGFFIEPIRHIQKGAVLDCGESGSTLRFMLPIAAAIGAEARFIRHGRLKERPLSPLYEELIRHGAILPNDPTVDPLTLGGKIKAGDFTLRADVSSQFISGLLLAMPLLGEASTLTLTGTVESKEYIHVTETAMARFGAAPLVSKEGRFYKAGAVNYTSPGSVTVEGDWSNAALWLAFGAIGKTPVTVTGLDINSPQGDKRIYEILSDFGAGVAVSENAVTVSPAPLSGIRMDASQIPDLVPALSAVAAAASGETVITGIRRLRLKESDRAAAVCKMLTSLGADVTEEEDALVIHGGRKLSGGKVSSHRDHRMVMCAALLSAIAEDTVSVTDAEAIGKSYPTFKKDYRALGGILTETKE